ncbi:hypothetical protein B0G66_103398 [Bacillus badius]|nr:hypothetical protein B0G66_103398 [Bacillus badius]
MAVVQSVSGESGGYVIFKATITAMLTFYNIKLHLWKYILLVL